MRNTAANLLAPIMKLAGFRFTKWARRGETVAARIVYRCIDTVHANLKADNLI